MLNNPKSLRDIHANVGIEKEYQKRIDKLIRAMQNSVNYWVVGKYRSYRDDIVFDAMPSSQLRKELRKRLKQWRKNFNKISDDLSKWFTENVLNYQSISFQKNLEDAGWNRRIEWSQSMEDTMRSIIYENVNLISSIPEQYFTEVEGIVMRSIQEGRGLSYLSKELNNRYQITKRRAETIARDQNNKATEAFNRTRSLDLGITKGIWRHNGGSKKPRLSHLKANGKEFDLKRGLYIDGEYTYPGQEINCKCTYRPIIEGLA